MGHRLWLSLERESCRIRRWRLLRALKEQPCLLMYHVFILIWPDMEYPFPHFTHVTFLHLSSGQKALGKEGDLSIVCPAVHPSLVSFPTFSVSGLVEQNANRDYPEQYHTNVGGLGGLSVIWVVLFLYVLDQITTRDLLSRNTQGPCSPWYRGRQDSQCCRLPDRDSRNATLGML